MNKQGIEIMMRCINDWNFFVRDVCQIRLDHEQQQILESVQNNPKTSVRSGTSRGKDYVAAWACFCFLILTPKFKRGEIIHSTKVAMTAPTDRQIKNIMFPEITKIYRRILKMQPSIILDHQLKTVGYDIRTDNEDWFLTGFKASNDNVEAWSGFHAPNVMFAVTEASGMDERIFESIEGNLQGNSRLLLVFNPNTPIGYAARSTRQKGWAKYKLNSLDSENVRAKKIIIPGQVDYIWLKDKVENKAQPIEPEQAKIEKNDFEFEGKWYRPTDWFRIKVLGEFPEAASDVLIPIQWIEAAIQRHKNFIAEKRLIKWPLKLGVDVAGMGNDESVLCKRYSIFLESIEGSNSGGVANHMETTGKAVNLLKSSRDAAFVDTVGEGAGVYSRLQELGRHSYSVKSGAAAKSLVDITQEFTFNTLRDYLFWSIRDWLNPQFNSEACIPDVPELIEELTEIKWHFNSKGQPTIEPKDDIKKRLKKSPDYADALAMTFYPDQWMTGNTISLAQLAATI